jgi:hypothetical protein
MSKLYRVYILSIERGLYQVGHTVFQNSPNIGFTQFEVPSMRGCSDKNLILVKASSPYEAVVQAISELVGDIW